jgi:serine/threonine protein kinase
MQAPNIPDFTIEGYCGSGAYGNVWVGRDRDGIRRAIKVLDLQRLKALGVLEREERAIRLVRRSDLHHPGLIEIHHAGETAECIYYVMDLADDLSGGTGEYQPDTLDQRLKRGVAFDAAECLHLAVCLLDALTALHSHGLVHRDIKPSNVLFVKGQSKLADLGLVATPSREMSLVGSPGFMPVEGITGPEGDLYSLGKLLYCVYTGMSVDLFPSLPKGRDWGDAVLARRINQAILKACDRRPGNRFRDTGEFRLALLQDRRRRDNLRMILRVAGVLALCGLATGGWYWHRERQESRRQAEAEAQAARLKADAEAQAIREAREAEERQRLLKESEAAIFNFQPTTALKMLEDLQSRWPEWADADHQHHNLLGMARNMAERAREMGGEGSFREVSEILLMQARDPKGALARIKALWERDPAVRASAMVIALHANLLLGAGQRDDAIALYQGMDAEGVDIRFPASAYEGRAQFYAGLGMGRESLADIEKAVALDPQDPTLLLYRAALLAGLKRPDEARRDIDAALALAQDNPAVIQAAELLRKRLLKP